MGLVALRGAFEVVVTLVNRGLMQSRMCMPRKRYIPNKTGQFLYCFCTVRDMHALVCATVLALVFRLYGTRAQRPTR